MDLIAPPHRDDLVKNLQSAFKGETNKLNALLVRRDGRRLAVHLLIGKMDFTIANYAVVALLRRRSKKRQNEISDIEAERKRRIAAELNLQTMASELNKAEHRERERLANILHGSLQQLLVSAKYRLCAVEKNVTNISQINEIQVLIDDAIQMSRSLASDLSPALLSKGLIPSLEWLARWMQYKLGLEVKLIASQSPQPVDSSTELNGFLVQAVRELLLNAYKHAGVNCARVCVGMIDNQLHVSVEDDGAGFDPDARMNAVDPNGFGLVSIMERISLLGGRFEMESAPGTGSRFRMIMPLYKMKSEGAEV
jgi:signal transduction histidine kinase